MASYAERVGLSDAGRLDDILDAATTNEDLARVRHTVIVDLDLGVDAGVETGLDLCR